jgi:Flp pilus assembly protein TadG
MTRRGRQGDRRSGQALTEFAFVLIPFMFLLMGVVDLGRAIAINNGVANAAREIARVTALHPGSTLGNSAETAEATAIQRKLVLNMHDPATVIAITCTNLSGTAVPSGDSHVEVQ